MANQSRRVLKDGIHFAGSIFIAPELAARGGTLVQVRYMPHDLRSIEVFTEDGSWVCAAHPQDALTRDQAEAVISQRRAAAREMGRRKAAASRKARARIAPVTAASSVEDITVPVGDRANRREATRRDRETGELLDLLGLGAQLNRPIPSEAGEGRA